MSAQLKLKPRFDWRLFCNDYRIPFVESGSNVPRGKIGIRCPYCQDPSEHMTLSLNVKEPLWGCWRCKKSGAYPDKLIHQLTGLNKAAIDRVIEQHNHTSLDEFDTLLDVVQSRGILREELTLPRTFHPLWATKENSAKPFLNYLAQRGFPERTLDEFTYEYRLHYCVTGDYALRVVLPIYRDGKLISYTGRTISPAVPTRYKSAIGTPIKENVANLGALEQPARRNDRILLVTEGPFDFLKLDFYGRHVGARATCVFGIAFSQEQEALLARVIKEGYARAFIVFDAESIAFGAGARMASALQEATSKPVYCVSTRVPAIKLSTKDPGELSGIQVVTFINYLKEHYAD